MCVCVKTVVRLVYKVLSMLPKNGCLHKDIERLRTVAICSTKLVLSSRNLTLKARRIPSEPLV